MSLTKDEAQEVIKKFRKSEKDTGSTEVQVALLTRRIQDCLLYTSPSPRD